MDRLGTAGPAMPRLRSDNRQRFAYDSEEEDERVAQAMSVRSDPSDGSVSFAPAYRPADQLRDLDPLVSLDDTVDPAEQEAIAAGLTPSAPWASSPNPFM